MVGPMGPWDEAQVKLKGTALGASDGKPAHEGGIGFGGRPVRRLNGQPSK